MKPKRLPTGGFSLWIVSLFINFTEKSYTPIMWREKEICCCSAGGTAAVSLVSSAQEVTGKTHNQKMQKTL